MKAAVLHEFKQPLTIQEIAEPKPEAGEVLIAVEACGVCHSDLHVADGDWTQLAGIVKKPLILGHEIVGRVVEKGAAVRELRIGDKVGVPGSTGPAASVNSASKRMRTSAQNRRSLG